MKTYVYLNRYPLEKIHIPKEKEFLSSTLKYLEPLKQAQKSLAASVFLSNPGSLLANINRKERQVFPGSLGKRV